MRQTVSFTCFLFSGCYFMLQFIVLVYYFRKGVIAVIIFLVVVVVDNRCTLSL